MQKLLYGIVGIVVLVILGIPVVSLVTAGSSEDAVYRAVMRGSLSHVERAIRRGADIDWRDQSGATPLMRAAYNQDADIVKLLVGNGADVNAVDEEGESVLSYAIMEPGGIEIAKYLLEHGADVRIADQEMLRAQRMVLATQTAFLITEGYLSEKDTLRLLIEHGADVQTPQGQWGRTLLHGAANRSCIDTVRILLKAGTDVNAAERRWGSTALHVSAQLGDTEICRALLEAGASTSIRNSLGETPAQTAAAHGNHRIASMLNR